MKIKIEIEIDIYAVIPDRLERTHILPTLVSRIGADIEQQVPGGSHAKIETYIGTERIHEACDSFTLRMLKS